MKKITTILALSLTLLCTSWAQIIKVQTVTFLPAQGNKANPSLFSYNFNSVEQNATKDVDFQISGLTAGNIYTVSVSENLQYVTAGCGTSTLNSLYSIVSSGSGTVGSGSNTVIIRFAPVASTVTAQIGGKACPPKVVCSVSCQSNTIIDNYGAHTATVTITEFPNVARAGARVTAGGISYTITLDGTNVIPTAVNDAEVNKQAMAYPNPVKDILYVAGAAEVFNMLGNKVASGINEINMTSLESGVYTVKVDGKFQKVVKE